MRPGGNRDADYRPTPLAGPRTLQDAVNVELEEVVVQLAGNLASEADIAGGEIGGVGNLRFLVVAYEAGFEAEAPAVGGIVGDDPGGVGTGRLYPAGGETASAREAIIDAEGHDGVGERRPGAGAHGRGGFYFAGVSSAVGKARHGDRRTGARIGETAAVGRVINQRPGAERTGRKGDAYARVAGGRGADGRGGRRRTAAADGAERGIDLYPGFYDAVSRIGNRQAR